MHPEIVLTPDLFWKMLAGLGALSTAVATVWASWKTSSVTALKLQVDSWEGLADVRKEEAQRLEHELEKMNRRMDAMDVEHHMLRKQNQELQNLNLQLQRENIELRQQVVTLQSTVLRLERCVTPPSP